MSVRVAPGAKSASPNVSIGGPVEVVDGPAAVNAWRESRAVVPMLSSLPSSQDKDRGEKSTSLQSSQLTQSSQSITTVDLNVQMVSPPKSAKSPQVTNDGNDNADNNNSSNKANDSKEFPSAVSKGKATLPPQSVQLLVSGVRDCTSLLSQLPDIHGWEVATWEFEQLANAKELEWEERAV
ncbi:hypothetical protein BS17DRAFT_770442 [Gyrodon lividus]|nr:hypothetical protein BS17DRAFT_770442 [Gyrodon lividus]